jgi:hypothetical protein
MALSWLYNVDLYTGCSSDMVSIVSRQSDYRATGYWIGSLNQCQLAYYPIIQEGYISGLCFRSPPRSIVGEAAVE